MEPTLKYLEEVTQFSLYRNNCSYWGQKCSNQFIETKNKFLSKISKDEKLVMMFKCEGESREYTDFVYITDNCTILLLRRDDNINHSIYLIELNFGLTKSYIEMIEKMISGNQINLSNYNSSYGYHLNPNVKFENIIHILLHIKSESGKLSEIIKENDYWRAEKQKIKEEREKFEAEKAEFEKIRKAQEDLELERKGLDSYREELEQKRAKMLSLSRKIKIEKEELEREKNKLKELSLSDLENDW